MNLWLIPFFPLLGFLLNGIVRQASCRSRVISLIAVGSVAAVVSLCSGRSSKSIRSSTPYSEHYFTWIQSGFLQRRL